MRVPSTLGVEPPRPASIIGAFSRWLVSTPWVVWTLVTVNLGSSVAGYLYWYGKDILAAPPSLWPFVPDSPLSATLWAVALLALHRGRRWHMFGLLAATGCIKYGLWTDMIWFTNARAGGHYSLEAIVMSANHFGMVLEGLVLLPLLAFRQRDVGFVALWYGLNDLVDYGLGDHPRVPNPQDIDVITAYAVGSTIVLVAIWLGVALRRAREGQRPSL